MSGGGKELKSKSLRGQRLTKGRREGDFSFKRVRTQLSEQVVTKQRPELRNIRGNYLFISLIISAWKSDEILLPACVISGQ